MLQLIMRLQRRFSRDEGQAMVEYALILALVSIVAIGALLAIGQSVDGIYQAIQSALSSATGGGGGS